MPPAARITDMHTCPMVTGVVPHVGGPILPPGAPTVLIDFLPAANVTTMATCVGPPDVIVKGSTGVLINFLPAARMGDLTAHGGVIVMGSPTCIIGEMGSPSPGAVGMGGVVAGLAASGITQLVQNPSKYSTAGSGGPGAPAGSSGVMSGLQSLLSKIGVSVTLPGAFKPSGDSKLDGIVEAVNPKNGTVNCGNIIDAVISRLNGSDPNAVSPLDQDGGWPAIEKRNNTKIGWDHSFQDVFAAVKAGGDGTTAIIGIAYAGGSGAHVLVITNDPKNSSYLTKGCRF